MMHITTSKILKQLNF